MATLSELTVQIITARLAKKDMSLEELQKEIVAISTQLKAIEDGTGQEPAAEVQAEPAPQKIDFKKIFKKDEVICLICNKGFKTLKKHLNQAHQLTDKEYRTTYNIPATQPLVAKAYSEKKKADAQKNNLGAKMQAGRKAKADLAADVPVVQVKAPVPSVKEKSKAPAVRVKVTVPAKLEKKATRAIAALKKMTKEK